MSVRVLRTCFVLGFATLGAVASACFADLSEYTSGSLGGDGGRSLFGDGSAFTPKNDASSRYCDLAGAHFLCADFDQDNFTASWTSVLTLGSSATLVTDTVTSPPMAMRVATPAKSAIAKEHLALGRMPIPISARHVHMEMSVRPCALSSGESYYLLLEADDTSGNKVGHVSVQMKQDTALAPLKAYARVWKKAGQLETRYPAESEISTAAFTRLVFDVDISTTAGNIQLRINDALSVNQSGVPTDFDGIAKRNLAVGLATSDALACTAFIDDVILDVE